MQNLDQYFVIYLKLEPFDKIAVGGWTVQENLEDTFFTKCLYEVFCLPVGRGVQG